MIFSTFNHLNIFLIFLFLGLIFGFIYLILNIIFLHCFSKNIIKNIINCIFYTFFTCFFNIFINIFNFGKINLTLITSCLVGYVWCLKVFKNLLVFYKNKCYTKNNKDTQCNQIQKKLKQ